ncbi:hypothetical protein H181DRAFT_02298 [Streptomyces sp. WMMB 714]|uniref:hypothetical protein n=1 Tax=Streptomyces sp. WMMB 714 TaxID=1286822 RepID=UPI0005F76FDC|nr:hypothetical protein [Streptomyces sp. WMMB 714]SCK29278.1 hypothetical protein H181DRAFT_02298 [Streptomyces sp. WMMB 714]
MAARDAGGGAPGAPVRRGFPHLGTVRAAITALHRRLPEDGPRRFGTSVLPSDVAFSDSEDLLDGAQRIARVMVHHFRLPDARVAVSFRSGMRDAAHVELTAGPEYFVELNARFTRHRRDIGAALAHEVAHVFLHRLGLSFDGTEDDEILTDTATTYLGAGWLLLDAFRQDPLSSQKLGYLTPEEYGYVLAKRAAVSGEDPAVWFTSPQAYEAYVEGRALARAEAARPPLEGAGWAERRRYARDRRRAQAQPAPPARAVDGEGYAFEGRSPMRVSFPCPVCNQRIRVPVRGRVRARCGLCRTVLECDT